MLFFFRKVLWILASRLGDYLSILFFGRKAATSSSTTPTKPAVPEQVKHRRRRASTIPTTSRSRYEKRHSRRRRGTSPAPATVNYEEITTTSKYTDSPEKYIRQSLSWLFRTGKAKKQQFEVCLCESSQWFMNRLRLVEKLVPGDGNCAFRSLVQAYYNGQINNYQQETELALELRRMASDELIKRKNDMTDPSLGMTIEEVVMVSSGCTCQTYKEYVQKMRTVEYAGEMELFLLAERLHVMISIYKPTGSNEESFTCIWRSNELVKDGEEEQQVKELRLVWHQGATELCNHYNALIPIIEEL